MWLNPSSTFPQNIAAHFEVRSVPTFIFFQKSEVIHRIRGADVNGIEAIILQHTSGDIPGSTSGPLTKDLEIPGQVCMEPGHVGEDSAIVNNCL